VAKRLPCNRQIDHPGYPASRSPAANPHTGANNLSIAG
jgi:hypothetical protein